MTDEPSANVHTASPVDADHVFLFGLADDCVRARGVLRVLRGYPEAGDLVCLRHGAAVDKLVGALPYDPEGEPLLIQPSHWERVAADGAAGLSGPPAGYEVRPTPSRAEYAAAVSAALARIRAGRDDLSKVVLARRLEVTGAAAFDAVRILSELQRDHGVSPYLLALPPGAGGAPRTLVGASPELLVSKQGNAVASLPVAGSAHRRADAADDREAAERLARSRKEKYEHRVVVEHVMDTLAPYCTSLKAQEEPMLTCTDTLWHLATRVVGDLRGRDISSLELARALHPTPAVCGVPSRPAKRLIDELEPFDRGYYAGAVGWTDLGNGDGHWVVTIRCAEISGNTAVLHAGAGIVEGSDPEREVRETSAKFATLLGALGVDEQGCRVVTPGS